MKTLYHGTTENAWECIQAEGFRGSPITEFTISRTPLEEGGVVYLTDDVEEALLYGDVVVAVHLEGVEAYEFDDGNSTHFYAWADELNAQAWWERII